MHRVNIFIDTGVCIGLRFFIYFWGMINANELRIGNLFNNVFNSPIVILSVVEITEYMIMGKEVNGIFNGSFSPNMINPIQITDEWLLKFGFETMDAETDFMEYAIDKDGTIIFSIMNDGGLDHKNENPFYITSEGQINGFAHKHKIEIKFIHQLQNIYFALTGEELKIEKG